MDMVPLDSPTNVMIKRSGRRARPEGDAFKASARSHVCGFQHTYYTVTGFLVTSFTVIDDGTGRFPHTE